MRYERPGEVSLETYRKQRSKKTTYESIQIYDTC